MTTSIIFEGHCKEQRGWKKPYDAIFTHLIPQAITEIGIGNISCFKDWLATFSDIPIIGIERVPLYAGGCVNEFSDVTAYQLNMGHVRYAELHEKYTIAENKRLHLYYNKDAYSSKTVDEYISAYGTQDIIINDGKQDGFSHIPFLQEWERVLKNPRSLLIQERILRNQDYTNHPEAVRPMKWFRRAIEKGWMIFDCRDQVKFTHHKNAEHEEGLFGVWTQDKEYWKQQLKHIPMVDTEEYYQRVIDRE